MVCLIGVGMYSKASESSLLELELLILTCDCKHMTRIPDSVVETFDNILLLASVSFCIN